MKVRNAEIWETTLGNGVGGRGLASLVKGLVDEVPVAVAGGIAEADVDLRGDAGGAACRSP